MNDPIRILQIIHTLNRAGVEQLVYELATKNGDQLQTAIICLDQEGPLADVLRDQGTEVFCTHRKPGLDLSQRKKIRKIIRSFKPQVIHCHQYTPFFYGSMAQWGLRGSRLIFTEHGRHVPDIVGWKRRWVNELLFRRADRITAVCEFTKDRLVEKEGIAGSRIEVIYNGVDLSRFESQPDQLQVRRELGLPEKALIVIQVGTFRPVKDQATAIRAFQNVYRQEPNAMLVFVGDGPDLAACRLLTTQLELDKAVRFLGQRSDIPELLAAADVMLMTSRSEAHSVSLLEGMACRLPIVATRVGGIPETVIDGQTGWLVESGDCDRMADRLLLLLKNPQMRQSMGQAGWERVRQLFLRDKMHRTYLDLYRHSNNGAESL